MEVKPGLKLLWGRIKGKLDDLKYKIKEKFDDKFG
jgi:hypothetical protein